MPQQQLGEPLPGTAPLAGNQRAAGLVQFLPGPGRRRSTTATGRRSNP